MEMKDLRLKDLRQPLLEKLGQYEFVVKIDDDEIEITESERKHEQDKAGTLTKKVIIHSIPFHEHIWRINVEKKVPGLSVAGRTVDLILSLVDDNCLRVYLIELKSRIDDEQLADIIKKLQESISRFYFLLLLNDSNSHKQFPDLKISFKGVIFYNGNQKFSDKEKPSPSTFEGQQIQRIHQIFKDEQNQRKGVLKCESILTRQSIPIQFYAKGFKDGEIRVSFADIAMK